MDSCDCDCDPHLLRSLLVFKNTINHELIKSLHVYELNEEKRNKVERKFVFRENGLYVELPAKLLLKLLKFPAFQVLQGHVNGCWICILAFHENSPPDFICIPSILSVSRIISNRASAQKSRLKKVQYVMEMEKKAKTLESQIAFLAPQVEFYTHQKQFLKMEQKSLNGKIAAYTNDKIHKDAEIEATKKEVARLRQLLDQKANIQAGANASSRMVNQKDAGLMEQMPTPGFNQSGPGKMSFSNSEKVGESSSEANKLKQVTVAQEEQQNQKQPVGLTTMAGQEPARSDQSVPQQKDKNKMNSEDGDQEMKDVMNFNEQKQQQERFFK